MLDARDRDARDASSGDPPPSMPLCVAPLTASTGEGRVGCNRPWRARHSLTEESGAPLSLMVNLPDTFLGRHVGRQFSPSSLVGCLAVVTGWFRPSPHAGQ